MAGGFWAVSIQSVDYTQALQNGRPAYRTAVVEAVGFYDRDRSQSGIPHDGDSPA
eukprot:SAG31_NODE_35579_length_321_cov_2.166667_1_plen_54_part_01